nr:immunoglobulin lambda-1 light chain-like [Labrus bergylta]
MLLLPAAALCCLCSALVSMAAELIQDDLSLTRRVGEAVSFSCGGTHQCYSDAYWYQKKDTETFRVILGINRSNGALDKSYNHTQEDDFSAVNKKNGWELQIKRVKDSHSATYYCSCLVSVICFTVWYIFGSGTKLFVTDKQVVQPVVSVYPAASRAQLEEKSSLLCVASAMFPPLVQISWKKQNGSDSLEDVNPADVKQQELRESGCSASILTISRENSTYKYHCSVQHQGGTVNAQTGTEVPVPTTSSPPEREPTDMSFQSQCKVKLLTLLYTVLILKSLVYCCGLSLLRIFRNNKPSIH